MPADCAPRGFIHAQHLILIDTQKSQIVIVDTRTGEIKKCLDGRDAIPCGPESIIYIGYIAPNHVLCKLNLRSERTVFLKNSTTEDYKFLADFGHPDFFIAVTPKCVFNLDKFGGAKFDTLLAAEKGG